MPELVLQLLKFLFLIVLYIFIARAVRAVYAELRPAAAEPAQVAPAPAPASPPPPAPDRRVPARVAVIEGGRLTGKSFDLGDELIIGRDSKCHLPLEDNYVSQVHARIFSRDNGYVVEDLGSTNGTYLNRRRIQAPTQLQRGDQLKIGKTVLEMRR